MNQIRCNIKFNKNSKEIKLDQKSFICNSHTVLLINGIELFKWILKSV